MSSQLTDQPTDWQSCYSGKLASAERAMLSVKDGDRMYIQSNAAAPAALIEALVARSGELRGVEIFHLLTLGKADYVLPEHADAFKVHALFIGPNVRDAVNRGIANYTPVFLSEIPALFMSQTLPVDVCLLQVSPPDEHGYCSYGVSIDCTIAARKMARVVIAQVNRQMPRTMGRSFVHVSKFDHIVECDSPLPELVSAEPGETETAIGRYVSELVDDGATLQMGIGAIPNAVLAALGGKKNLGLHTEMFSDGIIDLIERGVITNDCKTVLPGKAAVSFVMGTRRLYDFVHNNPMIEFQTSDFINDPFVIAQNHKMTAINSALQVDLTGQVCSDSVDGQLYSGFGGQVDFIRGASRAREGKAIIALPSTAKKGTISRIVPTVTGGVVTSRADVHYVVTEYGVAQLYGRNLKQRAAALLNIAHPRFRAELEEQCQRVAWLH